MVTGNGLSSDLYLYTVWCTSIYGLDFLKKKKKKKQIEYYTKNTRTLNAVDPMP